MVKKFVLDCPLNVNEYSQERLDECEAMLNNLENEEMAKSLYASFVRCMDTLQRLNRDGSGVLYKDFAPFSFGFRVGNLVGGMIFHGPIDGYGSGAGPTFSVCLEPTNGWSIHT